MDWLFFFFQAEDGIRDLTVTGVQTCALPILQHHRLPRLGGRHDQRPLAEAERADQVDDALRLRGARARRARRLEPERTRGMHRAELGELGSIVEAARGGGRPRSPPAPAVLRGGRNPPAPSRPPPPRDPLGRAKSLWG